MSIQTIVIQPSSQPPHHFPPSRPMRPLPRTRCSCRYAFRLKRDAVVRYHHLPCELWEAIHECLPSENIKSLALVNKHIGLFARRCLGRRFTSMEATSRVFRWFFASHSPRGIPAFAFKIRSITLDLSPPSQDNVSPSHSNVVLMHWKWVSRDLHHLRELAFLGTKVQFTGVRDLLADLPPTARLRRFICEDDRLLFGSLNSLLNHQETLEDFGGFFDTGIDKPPMTPAAFLDRFSNVHTLDVGMSFVTLQNHPGSVKSLCVRLDWTWMLSVVRSVWRIFGTTVRTLRLERNGVLDGRELHDGYPLIEGQESPLFLCTHLNMPALRYLEIRDTALAEAQREGTKPPCPDAESLGKPPPSDDYDGVCNLHCLAWRPWWAKQGGEYRNCADAFVRATEESWLPVRKVLMSLDERTSGVWDMWTRPDEDFPFERKCTWDAIKGDSWKHME